MGHNPKTPEPAQVQARGHSISTPEPAPGTFIPSMHARMEHGAWAGAYLSSAPHIAPASMSVRFQQLTAVRAQSSQRGGAAHRLLPSCWLQPVSRQPVGHAGGAQWRDRHSLWLPLSA